jgi:hypothetical protein
MSPLYMTGDDDPPVLVEAQLTPRMPHPWRKCSESLFMLYDAYGRRYSVHRGPNGWEWRCTPRYNEARSARSRQSFRTPNEALADLEASGQLSRG